MLLMAFAVLSIDIGRMIMIKSELQAFTDAAAMNAALRLDGSAKGLVHARAAAAELASGPNAMKWDMGTQPITAITTSFGTDPTGHPFVRVGASASVQVIFIRVFHPTESPVVAAASVAMKNPDQARLIQ